MKDILWIWVSIGEQTTPLLSVCKILHYAVTNYVADQLTICISSMHEYGEESKIQKLVDEYNQNFGKLPEQRIFLTENYYRNSDCMDEKAKAIEGRKVVDYMNGSVRCFEHTIGKYVLPRMLIKANGEVRTCACFNPPDELKIGNVKDISINNILQKINENKYVSIIAENGLHTFKKYLCEDDYMDVRCANECDACRILIDTYKRKEKI